MLSWRNEEDESNISCNIREVGSDTVNEGTAHVEVGALSSWRGRKIDDFTFYYFVTKPDVPGKRQEVPYVYTNLDDAFKTNKEIKTLILLHRDTSIPKANHALNLKFGDSKKDVQLYAEDDKLKQIIRQVQQRPDILSSNIVIVNNSYGENEDRFVQFINYSDLKKESKIKQNVQYVVFYTSGSDTVPTTKRDLFLQNITKIEDLDEDNFYFVPYNDLNQMKRILELC